MSQSEARSESVIKGRRVINNNVRLFSFYCYWPLFFIGSLNL